MEMIVNENDIRRIIREFLSEGKGSKESKDSSKPKKKDKSFVEGEDSLWLCWTRKEKDPRAESGTLAWREDVMKKVWRDRGLSETSEQAESVRDAAEKYLANNRYDSLFNAETDEVFSEKMSRILKAIAVVESRMNPRVNKGYGRGLMQLTQDAIDQVKIIRDKATKRNNTKINPLSPDQAVKGAAVYIRWLVPRPSVARGGLEGLLTAYNSGPYAEVKIDPFYSNKVMAMMDLMDIFESQKSLGDGQFDGLRTDLFKA